MAFIDEIKAAAAASAAHAETVHIQNEVSCSDDLLRALTCSGEYYYLDVPVTEPVLVSNAHKGVSQVP